MKKRSLNHSNFIFLLILIISITEVSSQIYINEFQSYNASSYLNQETGNYSDWLEIYNEGNSSVEIGGFFLTDDITEPSKGCNPDLWKT